MTFKKVPYSKLKVEALAEATDALSKSKPISKKTKEEMNKDRNKDMKFAKGNNN